MLAAVARDRRLHVEEVPEPVPGPGDALVAVRALRDLRLRPARRRPRREPGRDVAERRPAAHVRPHGRLRDGSRVLRGGPRARCRDRRCAGAARRPRRVDPGGAHGRRARGDRLLEHLQRRVRRADAPHRGHVPQGPRTGSTRAVPRSRSRWPSACTPSTCRASSPETPRSCSAADPSGSPSSPSLARPGHRADRRCRLLAPPTCDRGSDRCARGRRSRRRSPRWTRGAGSTGSARS